MLTLEQEVWIVLGGLYVVVAGAYFWLVWELLKKGDKDEPKDEE